ITLLDSLRKRVDFLDSVIEALDLEQIETIHSRAEDAANFVKMRESYDVAVSRAVANLPVLCEYCMPFVKIGGSFLALKGKEAENEVKNAEKAIAILGGKTEKIEKTFWNNMEHYVAVIRKTCKTPQNFPRKAGKPSKNPII
ncbi:MAG: class I SAM-dependent methyltransferase, partial [Clostridia bacterium]|nr:class I SAM-dependent methyltransferase [Clostridia bacterium]